jgi:Flp pilus assembly protein TadB
MDYLEIWRERIGTVSSEELVKYLAEENRGSYNREFFQLVKGELNKRGFRFIKEGKEERIVTPDGIRIKPRLSEAAELENKLRTASVATWLIAIPLGLIIVVVLLMVFSTIPLGLFIYPILIVAVATSVYLTGRVYRKHLEKKLGRQLKNSFEATSLTSWMEVSKKDKVPKEK